MPRVILAAALCASLAACSMADLAATGTRAALSAETVSTITGICRQAQPFVGLARLASSTTVKEDAGFLDAYCGQMLAGTIPLTTDGNTVNWLQTNLAGLRARLGR